MAIKRAELLLYELERDVVVKNLVVCDRGVSTVANKNANTWLTFKHIS